MLKSSLLCDMLEYRPITILLGNSFIQSSNYLVVLSGYLPVQSWEFGA